VPSISLTELALLSTLLVVFFGSRKLPEFIKGVADGVKQFKTQVSKQ